MNVWVESETYLIFFKKIFLELILDLKKSCKNSAERSLSVSHC